MTVEQKSRFARFADNLWLQAGIATGITVGWLIWIAIEILFKI